MTPKTPAVWMRGGTSKGLFFQAKDLPVDPQERERLILRVMGSPDPHRRQLDGMGGGISSLSKVAIIAPSGRPDADVDYTFVQVSVDRPALDLTSTCGNLTAAVGPFAIEEGLVEASDGLATVRIFNTNARQCIEARFGVAGGLPVESGDTTIAGVSFPGSPVDLRFADPAGSITGQVLPAGGAGVDIDNHVVSLIDVSALTAFMRADAFGLTGTETPEMLEARPDLLVALDRLRRAAAVRCGLAPCPESAPLATPRIALVSPPLDFVASDGALISAADYDIGLRLISMGRPHRAAPATAAMCLAAAVQIEGSEPARVCRAGPGPRLRIGHPGGVMEASAAVTCDERQWRVAWAGLTRTARRLMEGAVLTPRG
jgi:2-methylaconitate cis-trans-isomerase PrpF